MYTSVNFFLLFVSYNLDSKSIFAFHEFTFFSQRNIFFVSFSSVQQLLATVWRELTFSPTDALRPQQYFGKSERKDERTKANKQEKQIQRETDARTEVWNRPSSFSFFHLHQYKEIACCCCYYYNIPNGNQKAWLHGNGFCFQIAWEECIHKMEGIEVTQNFVQKLAACTGYINR